MSAKNPTEVRSYIVFQDKVKGLEVKPSHWVVGYTPAHKATPEEAVDYAIAEAEREMTVAQAKVVALHMLKVDNAWTPA